MTFWQNIVWRWREWRARRHWDAKHPSLWRWHL